MSRSCKITSVLTAGLMVLAVGSAQADTFTWSGSTVGTGNWSDSSKWTSSPTAGLVPSGANNTDNLVFNSVVATSTSPVDYTATNDIDVNPAGGTEDFVLNVLTLNGTHNGVSDSTLTATINVAGAGGALLLTNPGASTPTINLGALNNSTNNRAIVYDVQNAVKLGASTTVTGAGTATFKFTGGIDGSGFTLTKGNISTLTLGGTNTLGSLLAGGGTLASPGGVALLAGASLSVGSGSSSLVGVGRITGASTGTTYGLLDLSAAASFTANVGSFGVGDNTSSGGSNLFGDGTLKLAATNTITASTEVMLGEGSNNTGKATVDAGNGTTTVHTPLFVVGGVKSAATTFTLGATGSLTLDGTSGGRSQLRIGYEDNSTGGSANGTMTLDGRFNGTLSQLSVGNKAGGGVGGAAGALTLSSNVLNHLDLQGSTTVSTGVLTIGRLSGPSSPGNGATKGIGSVVIGHLDATSVIVATTSTGPAVLIGSYTGTATNSSVAVSAQGTLTMNGGTLSVQSAGSAPAILLANISTTVTGSTDSASGTLNLNGGVMTLNNAIAAGNASGSATATSTVNINGGTLAMGGKDIGSAANPLTHLNIQTGAVSNAGSIFIDGTFSGGGSVAGIVTVQAGGFLAPGNSIGALSVTGDVLLAGTMLVELDGAGAGSSDLLNVSNILDITAATVDFDALSLNDAAYIFASYGSLTGAQFASISNLPTGYTINYSYQGNQIALTTIPEPASLALLALGGAMMMTRGLRRNS
ncbi:MAG: PEP-CTERM sorting domain-containing protein [Phycisphaeraceae bacterium]